MGRPKMLVFSSHLFCPSSLIDRTWNQTQYRLGLAWVWPRNQDSPEILFQKIQNPEVYQFENLQCAKQRIRTYIKKRLLYWKVLLIIQGTDIEKFKMKYKSLKIKLLGELHKRAMESLQLNCKLSENILLAHSYHYKSFTSVSAGKQKSYAVPKSLSQHWVASHKTQELLVSGR